MAHDETSPTPTFSATKFRALRQNVGYTQRGLADELGVRYTSVSHWERGTTKPSVDHLVVLTLLLNCMMEDFFE